MVAVDELVRKATKAGEILTLVKRKLGSLNANSWKVTALRRAPQRPPPGTPLLLLIVRTPHRLTACDARQKLGDAIQSNTAVETLILTRNNLGSLSVAKCQGLAHALSNKSIKTVDLSNNNLSELHHTKAWEVLADAFESNDSIDTLFISYQGATRSMMIPLLLITHHAHSTPRPPRPLCTGRPQVPSTAISSSSI